MKSLFGFRDKAATAAKARVERVSSRFAAAQRPDFSRKSGGAPSSGSNVSGSTRGDKEPSGTATAANSSKRTAVDPVLEHLMRNARSDAVREEFLAGQPVSELIDSHEVRLLVGTYNVNGRKPPQGLDLRPWLEGASDVDVVVVGFQEIVPLNASNVMNDLVGVTGEAAYAWDRLISDALNPSPLARSYSCENGHLLAAPTPAAKATSATQQAGSEQPNREAAAQAAAQRAGADGELQPDGATPPQSDGNAAADTPPTPSGQAAPEEAFVQVAAKQMVGVYLSVWVRAPLLPHVRGVQVTSIGTGVLGYLGNKGAVAARLRIRDTGLALVVAHLSSGEAEGDELKRNYDYSEIVRRAAFLPDSAVSVDPDALNGAAPEGVSKVAAHGRRPGQWGDARGLLQCEHTIWLGDLNYRLSLPDGEARALLRKGHLDELARADELSNMRKSGRAFSGWQEGPLTFPPTFKFRRGTLQYNGEDDSPEPASQNNASPDSNADEATQKRRTPAWTDRVLWRSDAARLLAYASAELTASDHMPVVAAFALPVQEYNREKVEAAIESARRRVDAAEMAAMPHCELEPTGADFGMLRYGQPAACDIVLRNTGSVTASFQFMPLPGAMFNEPADKVCRPGPRWATVAPEQGDLEPGASADVHLSAHVTGGPEGTAESLASASRCKLDAVLVLRIQDGNDIFLPVSGTYAPSFFGLSLNTLASLPRPLAPRTDAIASPALPEPSPLRIDTASPARDPAAAAAGVEFYSPTSSLGTPTSELDDQSIRRRLDLQPSKLSQLAETDADEPDVEAAQQSGQDAALDDPASAADRQPGGEGAAADAADRASAKDDASDQQTDEQQQQQQQEAEDADLARALAAEEEAAYEAEQQRQGGLAELAMAAASSHDSPAVLALVPPEIRALTDHLRQPAVLRTPGLFINRADHILSQDHSKIVREIREALDEGRSIPERAGSHDVAATLLAYFAALPGTFMPTAAFQVCEVCVPSADAAASLMADALSPVEWAVFRHISGLMRAALAPEHADSNGLSAAALSALLADAWFGATPHSYGGAGGRMSEAEVGDLQRMAASVTALAERRAAFISLFLGPPAAGA